MSGWTLEAAVCALDGKTSISCRDEGPVTDPAELGIRVAEQLLARGAARIIAEQRTPAHRAAAVNTQRSECAPWPVVVTRDEPADGPLSRELAALGTAGPGLAGGCRLDRRAIQRRSMRCCVVWMTSSGWCSRASTPWRRSLRESPPPPNLKVAAVGARTALALRRAGWTVAAVPEVETAQGLVALLSTQLSHDANVLFAAGSRSLPTLRDGLGAAGARVTQVEAYTTDAVALDLPTCHDWIERRAVGAVTFTSPSAVTELDRALGAVAFDRLLDSATAIVMGTTTGRILASRGFPSVLAMPATLPGMAMSTLRIIKTRA